MDEHEIIVYQVYNSSQQQTSVKNSGVRVAASNFLLKLAKISVLVGILLVFFFYGPKIVDAIEAVVNQTTSQSFKLSGNEVNTLSQDSLATKETYEPLFNPSLPKTNQLIIPSIGVTTQLQEATYDNYEEALKKGVWRVSDFGAPGVFGVPTILAAHRFGYLAWSNQYRRQNSFYNLPKLKIGDTVEMVWHQRKYIYEVYGEVKGDQISDYSADLILYTCESLVGKERIFKYARLIKV